MADEPAGSSGQDDKPDVHHAPTQAWQGPGTPPPPPQPPAAPGTSGQQPPAPPAAPGAAPGRPDPHYAPTQAWQGPGSPPPQPPAAPGTSGQQPPAPPPSAAPGPSAPGPSPGQPDPHQAPTQAWSGPGTPPTPPAPGTPPGNYGYPQQPNQFGPPTAPPQGTYGYPQGQPGYPPQQQGYPQPGYPPGGYPQQPGYPMPPGGRSGGSRNGVIIGIVAGVVAIAVIAVGIGLAVSGGDDGPPDDNKQSSDPVKLASGTFQFAPERSVLWKVETPDAAPTDRTNHVGQWTGEKTLVVGDQKGLTGYDIKTGVKQWTSEGPTSGASPCAMSGTATADGLGAVLYRTSGASSSGPCTLLAVIDTATGQAKWSQEVRTGAEDGRDNSVAIDEKNKRVYSITSNMAFSHDLTTGKKNWEAGGAKYCNLSGEAAPTAIVVEQTCFDTNKTVVASLDLADGHNKSRWKYTVPGDSSAKANILSADPAVAGINPGSAAARGNIVMFDSSGKPGSKIGMSQPFGKLEPSSIYDSVPRYAFKGTTMIATVGKGSGSRPTTIAAFDLSTGQAKWSHEVGTSENPVQVVGFDGDNVLAAQSGGYSGRGRLVHLPLSNGTPVKGGLFPEESTPYLERDRMVVDGDLIYVITNYASRYTPRVTAFGPTG